MRTHDFLPLIALACSAAVAQTQPARVRLSAGVTPLASIGIYTVRYQAADGDVITMPPSWTGHFEDRSGISYVPGGQANGRPAMLLHSPWRLPSGRVWVEYPLVFPDTRPIEFRFAIAMREDVAVPGKSDGATFGVSLVSADGQEEERVREFRDVSEWKEFRLDLSDYAGRGAVLRLEVDPGPQGDASWDYSYFGEPRIVVGTDAGAASDDLVRALLDMPAHRLALEADLRPLLNDPARGVLPSTLDPCTVSLSEAEAGFEFQSEGPAGTTVFRYTPVTGTLDDLSVRGGAADTAAFCPTSGGGLYLAGVEGGARPVAGQLVSAEIAMDSSAVVAVFRYPASDTESVQAVWRLSVHGRALRIQVQSSDRAVERFELGSVASVPLRRVVAGIPYFPGEAVFVQPQNVFVGRFLDWTRSYASRCEPGRAVYSRRADSMLNPLREDAYVAVSPTILEVLPNVPHPQSPYRELLGGRIMLDIWGHRDNSYEGDARNLRLLKDSGVDHLAIIQHVWQRYGYDVKLPDHLPADPRYGGDEGMAVFGAAARDCGYVWSVHENYIDIYPDAPSYDESAVVLRSDGSRSHAWFNTGTGVQSFGLKCNRALEFAMANSPEIHRRFGTTAAYLDVHTCVPPWHQLDHDAAEPLAAMGLLKVWKDAELFQYMRHTHGGPLFGEGANHFYWAGLCDGVEAQVIGGEDHRPFPDFNLLKIHPQMVNHGMGYYERWFQRGYDHRWGHDTGTMEQIDKYRAQELAYGHAGFVGNAQTGNVQWVVREHHLMHPVQRLYGNADVRRISYFAGDGVEIPGSVALVTDVWQRQRIEYDSDLVLFVNWGADPWPVEDRTLEQWSAWAVGPGTEVLSAVKQDGSWADFARCPAYVFVDARTSFDMPYVRGPRQVEPRLSRLEPLGNGRIRIAYEWEVGAGLDEDYMCFVHFLSEGSDHAEGIVQQQDHGLPIPTTRWQPGETVADGPYEVELPGDGNGRYEIVIGLHNTDGRLHIRGVEYDQGRIHLGTFEVETDDGGEMTLTLDEPRAADGPAKADFGVRLNPAGTVVDFGPVATDGSVKVELGGGSLLVHPYPRDRRFRVWLDTVQLGGPAPEACRVVALAALTRAEQGGIDAGIENGRLVFEAGAPDVGCYRVEW